MLSIQACGWSQIKYLSNWPEKLPKSLFQRLTSFRSLEKFDSCFSELPPNASPLLSALPPLREISIRYQDSDTHKVSAAI